MNLAIDIGNTRAKAAVFDGDNLVEVLVVEEFTGDDLSRLLEKHPTLDRAIVSSVRDGEEGLVEWLRGRLRRVIVFDHTTPVPIENAYRTPETLGLDRLAAAVGTAAMFPGEPVLIVDFGTAITVDHLTADGTFRGGNISPGAAMRFRALHEFTGKLPLEKLTGSVEESGTTTAGAIQAGVTRGIIHEIEGYAARFCGIYPSLRIVFTGGDAKYFEKRVKFPIFVAPHLVLQGLNQIAKYNA